MSAGRAHAGAEFLADWALTNRPRPLIAACQIVDPDSSGLLTLERLRPLERAGGQLLSVFD
jgi:hypothetical protein